MTYDQYWYEDPQMVRTFREADKLRQARVNEEAWLNGVYVAYAVASTIGNAYREKGMPKVDYPEKPIEFREPEKVDEDTEALMAQVYMNNMVRAGRNWGKRKEVSDG